MPAHARDAARRPWREVDRRCRDGECDIDTDPRLGRPVHVPQVQQQCELVHDQCVPIPYATPNQWLAGTIHYKGDEADPEENPHAPYVVVDVDPPSDDVSLRH